tara:strand:- start:1695 stop:1931 length:237 start_codon:yes stop_codon:yes gene_type:complete
MELRVANLQGNSPNFRVTIDDTLIVRGTFNLSQQSYLPVPSGTTAQRPSKTAEASLYFNTEEGKMQIYAKNVWRDLNE